MCAFQPNAGTILKVSLNIYNDIFQLLLSFVSVQYSNVSYNEQTQLYIKFKYLYFNMFLYNILK